MRIKVVPKTTSGSPATGVWTNVTPAGLDPATSPTQTVGADPANPGTLYTTFDAAGIWKSTDYGLTWVGPVNTGTNAANITSNGGSGLTVGSGGVLHFACIRGNLIGYFRSADGGVNWTNYDTPLPSGRKDVYYPQIDPYNSSHLLMTGHEQAALLQSSDGGLTWASVNMDSGMLAAATGTAFAYFVNTGSSGTTANTWVWIGQGTGGSIGTWRTTNAGSTWTQVSTNEHGHGTSCIYQPNTTGDVFMAGVYAAQGWGVMHSFDYGVTWANVSTANFGSSAQNVVIGTSKFIYSNNGSALPVGSSFIQSPVPGTGATWTAPAAYPNASWPWGAGQFAVVNDGSHNILIAANWVAGLWRYIEP